LRRLVVWAAAALAAYVLVYYLSGKPAPPSPAT